MKRRLPSRVLNDNSVLFGLSFSDLVGCTVVLAISQALLKPFHLEPLALVVFGLSLMLLAAIRLKYRRRYLRDRLCSLIERVKRRRW